MARVEIKGTVDKIGEVEKFEKFQKRIVVIDDGDKYPNPIAIELVNDDVDAMNGVKVGDFVEVSAFVNGRYWEKGGKYFTSLRYSGHSAEGSVNADELPTQDDEIPF